MVVPISGWSVTLISLGAGDALASALRALAGCPLATAKIQVSPMRTVSGFAATGAAERMARSARNRNICLTVRLRRQGSRPARWAPAFAGALGWPLVLQYREQHRVADVAGPGDAVGAHHAFANRAQLL